VSAGNLSGGEQQMLALSRALIPPTKLLFLDEPSLGLAPNLLGNVFKKLVENFRCQAIFSKNFSL
jgi:branched-chain amino acid transport system ATP-binding protein